MKIVHLISSILEGAESHLASLAQNQSILDNVTIIYFKGIITGKINLKKN